MRDPLARLARRMGIVASYTDQTRTRRRTSRATMRALLAAMGVPAQSDAESRDHLSRIEAADAVRRVPKWIVCTPGATPDLALPPDAEWRLFLEDAGTHAGRGTDSLPALPLGLHSLHVGTDICTIITAPPRLPLPHRTWGMMLPLHALRSPDEGGLGDYTDLAVVGEGLARQGADFLGLNPIHAGFFADPGGFSPYTPSHRRRLSAFHVPAPETPAPNGSQIDYATEIPLRRAALETAFRQFRNSGGDPRFDAFRLGESKPLERFALHQALSDTHGAYWTDWPDALQDPDSPDCARAAQEMADTVTFHAWLQWRAHESLADANRRMRDAGMGMGLYLDLAVGTHPAGAETWEDRESFAFGASLGAPPDAFSADGQAWGLAPFNPHALVAQGFRPLAETLRCQLALAGALRIDHILGFERAFWVPSEPGLPGAYVQMPRDAMLAVLRLEAARANAVIVGEDLGNIPRGLRKALRASGILGCRVQLFERIGDGHPPRFRPPEKYERAAIASFSTHDLPTWAGWRSGHEIAARRDLGHISPGFAEAEQARRAGETAQFDSLAMQFAPAGTDPASADAMHHALAASRSALVMVQAENVLEIAPQPNLPGTTSEYPNWRQRLPLGARALPDDPRVTRTAAIMARHGR